MITAVEVVAGLGGAIELARGRPSGFRFFDRSPRGFYRSFYAGLIAAPAHFVLVFLSYLGDNEAHDALRYFSVELIAYVIAWTAFPVVAARMVRPLGRWDAYIPLIVAYNWAGAVQTLAFFPLGLLAVLGIGEPLMVNFLTTVYLVAVLIYVGFIVLKALDVPMAVVGGFVAADFLISLLVEVYSSILVY